MVSRTHPPRRSLTPTSCTLRYARNNTPRASISARPPSAHGRPRASPPAEEGPDPPEPRQARYCLSPNDGNAELADEESKQSGGIERSTGDRCFLTPSTALKLEERLVCPLRNHEQQLLYLRWLSSRKASRPSPEYTFCRSSWLALAPARRCQASARVVERATISGSWANSRFGHGATALLLLVLVGCRADGNARVRGAGQALAQLVEVALENQYVQQL